MQALYRRFQPPPSLIPSLSSYEEYSGVFVYHEIHYKVQSLGTLLYIRPPLASYSMDEDFSTMTWPVSIEHKKGGPDWRTDGLVGGGGGALGRAPKIKFKRGLFIIRYQ